MPLILFISLTHTPTPPSDLNGFSALPASVILPHPNHFRAVPPGNAISFPISHLGLETALVRGDFGSYPNRVFAITKNGEPMPARILLVEDDPTLRESLTHQLSVAGYEMTEADTLEALHNCLHDPAPEALLLDLHLPDGDGLSALPEVKRNWPDCKVVILSADGSLEATEAVYQLDDVFLLSKPLDPEMLESVLGLALTQRANAA